MDFKYGTVYGKRDQNSGNAWVSPLEEQETADLNGRYQEEVDQAKQLEHDGYYADANKIYMKVKQSTRDRRIHRIFNDKITRNLVVLRKNLQERQSEFKRAQTASLSNRRQSKLQDYDTPKSRRNNQGIEYKREFFEINKEAQYQQDFFSAPPQQVEEEYEEIVVVSNKNRQQPTGINGGEQYEKYQESAKFINDKYNQIKNTE